MKQIRADPTTSSLHEVARLMESLHGSSTKSSGSTAPSYVVLQSTKSVFSRHGRIFSRRDHISPVDEIWLDNTSSEIDVKESTGLDGTQNSGDLSLMPGTSPEGAKLGRATCSSTHVAIDMSLKKQRWLCTARKPTELACRDHLPMQTV